MSQQLRKDLERIVGSEAVSTDDRDRIAYSRDMWPRNMILLRCGVHRPYSADIIVWPGSPAQVASIVRFCTQSGVKLIPYGGGSGVCGGAVPKEGGIILDLKRLDAVREIDPALQTVDVQAGVIGQNLESEMNRQGFTCGHFPTSMACSTVGGWIASRAAGQMCSLYGKIEDLVSKIRVVTMDGEITEVGRFPWKPRGPSWLQLFLGSEGILGIVVDARLRVFPLPERRAMRAARFSSFSSGMDCIREVTQMGARPSVMLLLDPIDTLLFRSLTARRAFLMPDFVGKAQETLREMGMNELLRHPWLIRQLMKRFGEEISAGVLLIAGFEGRGDLVEAELNILLDTVKKFRGTDLGEETGNLWLRHRLTRAFRQSPVFHSGGFTDTLEVSATWNRVPEIYTSVMNELSRHVLSSATLSHPYAHGCSMSFTLAGSASTDEQMLEKYDATWRTVMKTVIESGGTLSHHHGVGMLKSSALRDEMGNAFQVLSGLKAVFDADYLLNPGKMI
jgi:alkyldihydroxyacetonephosphate synthase